MQPGLRVNVAKVVRILSKKAKPTFGETLEEKARQLTGNTEREGETTVDSIVEQEIALVVNHIDRLRAVHKNLHRSLLQIECYVDTEIIQREPRDPVYVDYRLAERDRLRNRLFKIEEERRKLAVTHEDKIQTLRDRLLSLMQRHAQLTPHNGHRKDRP